MPSRRTFLARVAGGTAAVGSLGVLASPAAAEHFDAQPDHVTLSYDQTLLERYRPRLVLPQTSRQKFTGLYGWIAQSPERDTSVAVYWASYTHQEGWLGNFDSHYGDHEPCYVVYDSSTGEVTRVVASVYHWLKGSVPAASAPLYDQTHPHLRVIQPWHQYTARTAADSTGAFYGVEDLTAAFGDWLDNGLEASLYPGAVVNPWIMRQRGHWWRETAFGISRTASLYRIFRSAGIDEAGGLEVSG